MPPIRWRRRAGFTLSVIASAASLAFAGFTSAHGGQAEIALKPDTVMAGETVAVAGENFEDIEMVELLLVGAGAKVLLGRATVGGDGHLTVDVVVPVATAAGPYVLEAYGAGKPLASAALTVTAASSPSPQASASASASGGPASSPPAGPSSKPSSAPGPTASAEPSPSPVPDPEPTGSSDTPLLAAVVVIAVVAGVGGGIVLARRGRQAG